MHFINKHLCSQLHPKGLTCRSWVQQKKRGILLFFLDRVLEIQGASYLQHLSVQRSHRWRGQKPHVAPSYTPDGAGLVKSERFHQHQFPVTLRAPPRPPPTPASIPVRGGRFQKSLLSPLGAAASGSSHELRRGRAGGGGQSPSGCDEVSVPSHPYFPRPGHASYSEPCFPTRYALAAPSAALRVTHTAGTSVINVFSQV